MKKIYSFLCLSLLVMATGCIKNDIDYAVVPLAISELTVEGQIGNTVFSEDKRTATVNVEESVNLKEVKITNIEYEALYEKDTANVSVEPVRSSLETDVVDLSKPYSVTLSLYQDYEWTLQAEQNIERYFEVVGQIGDAVFDVEQKTATVHAVNVESAEQVVIKRLKLGPKGATTNKQPQGVPEIKWQESPAVIKGKVLVEYSDFIHEEWTLNIRPMASHIMTLPADAWVNVSWLHGVGASKDDTYFEYRELGAEQWLKAPKENMTFDDIEFSCRLAGLKAETSYEYRAVSGNTFADPVTFTTVAPADVPNMGFENWSMQKGKVVCPWAEGEKSFWDCGNWGSTTLGAKYNITTSDTDVPAGSTGKFSARLETKSILGILATGNMFVGQYKKTIGFNGLLGMGRSFDSYPTRLTGYYKYHGNVIEKAEKGYEYLLNTQDSCFIYIALGDWEDDGEGTYVKIQTDKGKNQGTYFDVNDPHIIAYGSMATDKRIDDFTKFSIELDYRAIDRRPTSILMVFAASKYGDFFTGAPGSVLWIDDLNLEYDY